MTICLSKIDEEGRLHLPPDIADFFRKKGVHYAIVAETWDGYRLEPVGDAEAVQMQAEETEANANPVSAALRALGADIP